MLPRLPLSARSLSQLSVTTKMPAMAKPDSTRMAIQAQGLTNSARNRNEPVRIAAKAAKARIWPTCATIAPVQSEPKRKPAK